MLFAKIQMCLIINKNKYSLQIYNSIEKTKNNIIKILKI